MIWSKKKSKIWIW